MTSPAPGRGLPTGANFGFVAVRQIPSGLTPLWRRHRQHPNHQQHQ